MKNIAYLSIISIAALGATSLEAGLIGDTVTVRCVSQLPSPNFDCLFGGGPSMVLVDGFEEGQVFSNGKDVIFDIAAEAIFLYPASVITFAPSMADFTGRSQFLTFSGLDWVGMPDAKITGVDVVIDGPLSPPLAAVTFTDHSVTVDFGDSVWADDTVVTINLQTAAVPEPSTVGLLAAGLLAMGWMRRRRSGRA